MKSKINMSQQFKVVILSVCILLAGFSTAGASDTDTETDMVVVKGTRLEGYILGFDSEGIRFDTIYAKGEVLIAYEDIESLESRGEFRFTDQDGQEILGHILGMKEGKLAVGESWEKAVLLDTSAIRFGIPEARFQSSFTSRLRTRYPWWKADLHLGWNIEQTAIDKVKISAGLNLERRKKPTRLLWTVDYALDVQGKEVESYQTTKDEFRALVLGEYDLSKRWYTFLEVGVEWDQPRGISVRTYPSAGVGFRLVETEKSLLQFQTGPGYVYENFIGFGRNDYAAIHLGLEARHTFWKYLRLTLRLMYMPKLTAFTEDWLYRSELILTVPITDLLSMRLVFSDTNDNNPSEDVGNNKFTTTLGLSFTY